MAQAIYPPSSAVENLAQQQLILQRPEVTKMVELDRKMATILSKRHITPDERLREYEKALLQFRAARDNVLINGTMMSLENYPLYDDLEDSNENIKNNTTKSEKRKASSTPLSTQSKNKRARVSVSSSDYDADASEEEMEAEKTIIDHSEDADRYDTAATDEEEGELQQHEKTPSPIKPKSPSKKLPTRSIRRIVSDSSMFQPLPEAAIPHMTARKMLEEFGKNSKLIYKF